MYEVELDSDMDEPIIGEIGEALQVSKTAPQDLFRQETDLLSIPETLRRRMMIYPQTSRYYVCDSDSTSVCDINIDEEITIWYSCGYINEYFGIRFKRLDWATIH
jgi:hypothetical protein